MSRQSQPAFLSSLCGKKLIEIVSEGAVLLTQLQRMAQHVPEAFYPPTLELVTTHRHAGTGTVLDRRRFEPLLFDFSYFRNEDEFQEKIERSAELSDLDQTFREQQLPILERFYKLFTDIYLYYIGLQQFMSDVEDGIYIEFTFQAILYDVAGKRLMCESLYLYGVMLLLTDRLIPGPVRERLIVAHFRAKGQSNLEYSKEVVRLFKGTGYLPGGFNVAQRRPKNYPVDYFKRYSVRGLIVQTLINQIKDDDIYKQLSAFPLPDHRSVALSNQGSMIFVLLFFDADLLSKQRSKMREIADKHFSDNWVVPIYLGYIADLVQYWMDFPAAKTALANNITLENVKFFAQKHSENLKKVQDQLTKLLAEGTLTEDSVLDNINRLMQWMRQANVTVRWSLLHRNSTGNKKVREMLLEYAPPMEPILNLVLTTAQFEQRVKKLLTRLVKKKQKMWNEDLADASYLVGEIAQFYAGNRNHGKGFLKDEKFEKGFNIILQKVQALNFDHATVAGRQISDLIGSLDDALQYRQVDGDFQVKHFIDQTKQRLEHMIRCVNIKKADLVNFTIVSDFSYAFSSLPQYLELMQKRILQGPKSVLRLRSLFLKMASLLTQPLQRIIESNNKEALYGVSRYYSSQLVRFVIDVLQVIPISIFGLLDKIALILAKKVKEIPLKLQKIHLKEYAQFDERFELAKLTHQITIFTEGMLTMDKCLMGVIEVDPKKLLVQGIRRELTEKIGLLLNDAFTFKKGSGGGVGTSQAGVVPTVEEFVGRVKQIGERITGMKRAFMYIQDFLDIRGDFMWNEQMNELINGFTDRETAQMLVTGRKHRRSTGNERKKLKRVVKHLDDDEEDEIALILSKMPPVDVDNATFIGRLGRGILGLIETRKTFYWDQGQSWYDFSGSLIFGELTVHKLEQGVGLHILKGIDKFYQFFLLGKISTFQRAIKQCIEPCIPRLKEMQAELADCLKLHDNAARMYSSGIKILSDLAFRIQPLVIAIGSVQLVRRILVKVIKFTTKFEAGPYAKVLANLDEAMMAEWIQHQLGGGENTQQEEEKTEDENNTADQDLTELERRKRKSELVGHVVRLFQNAGLTDPLQKVYVTTSGETDVKYLPYVALSLAVFVIRLLPELRLERRLGMVVKKSKGEFIDGAALAVGVWTVLKQYHINMLKQFLAILSHFVKTHTVGVSSGKEPSTESASTGGVVKAGPKSTAHVSGFTGELQGQEVATLLGFLRDLVHYSGLPCELVTQFIPDFIANVY